MQHVCINCFADTELRGLIASQNFTGNCDCCGNNNVAVIAFAELLDFFSELLDNFVLSSVGIELLSLIQSNWNLFADSARANKILETVFSTLGSEFQNPNELATFNDEIIENVGYWLTLKEQLKWERRYFTNIEYLTNDLGWDSFFESKTTIQKSDILFRARLHQRQNELPFANEEMFCPPKETATAGRANPLGIPYLYLSDNQETILHEIRASYLDEISVGHFELANSIESDVVISDFTEVTTLFHPSDVNKRIKSTLLKHSISDDLSKPMRRYTSELDYVPTQFICEFIKVFTDVRGIKFKSSLHEEGNNIVIFDQSLMECTKVDKIQISEVTIKSKEL